MEIDLRLYATLAGYQPENADTFSLEEGTTVGDVIQQLGVPLDDVKLIFVNGHKRDRSFVLSAGDRMGLFPPVGGG